MEERNNVQFLYVYFMMNTFHFYFTIIYIFSVIFLTWFTDALDQI